jgi:hypothetical protein
MDDWADSGHDLFAVAVDDERPRCRTARLLGRLDDGKMPVYGRPIPALPGEWLGAWR